MKFVPEDFCFSESHKTPEGEVVFQHGLILISRTQAADFANAKLKKLATAPSFEKDVLGIVDDNASVYAEYLKELKRLTEENQALRDRIAELELEIIDPEGRI